MLTVKNVKTFQGNEGTGYTCTLYWNNKKAGTATDDAWGGPLQVWWDKSAPTQDILAWAKQHPAAKDATHVDPIDFVIEELVSEFETHKRLKRHAKTKTLFRLNGDKPGEWRIIPKPFTSSIQSALFNKYPHQIETIYNATI